MGADERPSAVQAILIPFCSLLTGVRSSSVPRPILDQAAGRPGHIFNLGHAFCPDPGGERQEPANSFRSIRRSIVASSPGLDNHAKTAVLLLAHGTPIPLRRFRPTGQRNQRTAASALCDRRDPAPLLAHRPFATYRKSPSSKPHTSPKNWAYPLRRHAHWKPYIRDTVCRWLPTAHPCPRHLPCAAYSRTSVGLYQRAVVVKPCQRPERRTCRVPAKRQRPERRTRRVPPSASGRSGELAAHPPSAAAGRRTRRVPAALAAKSAPFTLDFVPECTPSRCSSAPSQKSCATDGRAPVLRPMRPCRSCSPPTASPCEPLRRR